MKIMLFEFRKIILRKSVIIPMGVLLIANMVVIYAHYRFNIDVFSDEVNAYNSSSKEWNYYKKLHEQLDGEITEEKQDKVIALYNDLKKKIDKGDYDTKYTESAETGYVYGDYSLVESNFYLPMKRLVSYADKTNKLVIQAKKNIEFFKKADNRYEIQKNKYIVDKYSDRVIREFYDTTGWKKLFDYDFSDVILTVFLFLCVLPLFHQERICGMEHIILVTKKGRKMYLAGKYVSVITGMILCTVLVAGINYVMFNFTYGLKGAGTPLYALEEFEYSPYKMTVLQTYLVIQGVKCIALVTISTLMCLIVEIIKNTMASFVILIGIIVSGLYGSGYICSDNVNKVMAAIVSPFSLFKSSKIFKALYEINLLGTFELRTYVCIAVQIILEVVLICISYYKYKHSGKRKVNKG